MQGSQIVLSFVLILNVLCIFNPLNISITLPDSPQQFDYSPDHRFLGLLSPTQFIIVSTQTGQQIQKPIQQNNQTMRSFAFNKDSTLLALGLKNGKTILYNRVGNSSYVRTNKSLQSTSPSAITELCFSSDNRFLILGQYLNQIIVWNIDQNKAIYKDFNNQYVNTIYCSPTINNQFVVGGGQNTISKFTLYAFNELKIEQLKNISNGVSPVIDSIYSHDGSKIIRIQRDGRIIQCNQNGQMEQQLYDTKKSLQKIRMSINGRVISLGASLTIDTNEAYILIESSNKLDSLKTYSIKQTLATKYSSIALTGVGSYLFYVDSTGKAVVSNECKNNQFADDNGLCTPCNPECQICDGNADNCFTCSPAHFLNGNTCESCSVGCLSCSSATDCASCDTAGHFIPDVSGCKCEVGYFLNGQVCSACGSFCTDCISSTQCTTCKDSTFVISGGDCVCSNGTYLQVNICLDCTRGCTWCNNGATCNICNKTEHYIVKNLVCDCDDYFYDDGSKCKPCEIGCIHCDSQVCKSCDTQKHWELKEGQCKCQNSYFQKQSNCQACIIGCQLCADGQKCITCKTSQNFILKDDKCQCMDKSFYIKNQKCLQCSTFDSHCLACQSQGHCLACQQQFELSKENKCVCKIGKYQEKNLCLDCPQSCLSCINKQKCTQCKQGYQLVESQCTGSGGLATSTLLAIILGSLIVVTAAGVLIFIKYKKKAVNIQSIISQDDYAEL